MFTFFSGFTVVAFNRTVSKVDDFLANEAKGRLDTRNFQASAYAGE